jgi:glycine/D-amino acid oxidase-like deaminating enzyme
MKQTFDWIVVGAGITGAAAAYELAKQGCSVLLTDRHATPAGATRYGYGGIAYWSGTTALMRQLCAAGIALQRSLSQELDSNTEFRELDLLLTIAPDADPQIVAQSYAAFAIPPQLLTVSEACELEPLLNPAAIAGALTVKHGHINLLATTKAYTAAFERLGGKLQLGQPATLIPHEPSVNCAGEVISAANVLVCAGGLSRSLLQAAGIPICLYFTQAESIEVPPMDLQLRSFVMPAQTRRFELEAAVSTAEKDALWDQPGHELAPAILDAGAVQFLDGSLKIGQISRTVTTPNLEIDPTASEAAASEAAASEAAASEAAMRTAICKILPALESLPGQWHRCLVGFSRDRLPLIGAIPGTNGIHVFSGFSNPLAIVPTLARQFAVHATGQPDDAIEQMSPTRFAPK